AAFQHIGGHTIYWLGTSIGLYAADTLRGDTTVWVGQGALSIGNSVVDMVDVRQQDGLVAVATHAHGIYTQNITSLSQITRVNEVPDQIAADDMKVYPNPVTSKASVSFNLQHSEEVTLHVFDEQGRLVQQMNQGKMTEGNHTLALDASACAPGIYFCSLNMGGKVVTKRIVVVK